jgi:PKD repeat protein
MIRAVAVRGVAPFVLWVGLSTSLLAQGTSTLQNPTATFSTYGPHQVTLTACNMWGCTSITKTVTVLDPRPAVTSATVWVSSVEAGQAVPLTGAGTGQPPLGYTWRVYQGTSLVQELPGASAWWPTGGVAPGLYTLVLGITNASGAAESLPKAVLVGASTPLDFYTVEPCRVLDTRFGSPLGSGTAKIVSLTDVCGIPAGARAIAANVTVPAPAVSGNVALYPGNYPSTGTSTINFSAGKTIANNATLPLSTDGTGMVAALASFGGGGTVNLVIDVAGYYLPEAP